MEKIKITENVSAKLSSFSNLLCAPMLAFACEVVGPLMLLVYKPVNQFFERQDARIVL